MQEFVRAIFACSIIGLTVVTMVVSISKEPLLTYAKVAYSKSILQLIQLKTAQKGKRKGLGTRNGMRPAALMLKTDRRVALVPRSRW